MADESYPLFPVFAFLGFILALVPLPWHFEAWNSATCYYMAWASLACLNQFVNSVVWAHNALNQAPIWCDISTRITIGASVGIPAASLCINRRLYMIARVQAMSVTRAEKRRAILIDSLICVLFPMLCIVLAYVVQGHRFNIYEEIGCYPAIYNTLLAYFLVNWWPIVLGLISAIYCVLSLRAFSQRRAQFKEFLSSSNSSLTFGRYFRLMALATTELMLTLPISSYAIYLNATTQAVDPWVSWKNTHYDFSRVVQVPSVVWRMNHELVIALELDQWLNPVCALIFFAYFGFASEARRNYKLAFWAVARRVGFFPGASEKAAMHPLNLNFARAMKAPPSNLASASSSWPTLPPYTTSDSLVSSASVTDIDEKAVYLETPSPLCLKEDNHSDVIPCSSLPSSPSHSPSVASFAVPSLSGGHSIAFTDLESLYGRRLPSFCTLEVDTVCSEPPSPASHVGGRQA